jgi:prepilin-type N-terminal cleavage/methylation domain-containing protein/prepilin-type processing-associated H-X9-DG protein
MIVRRGFTVIELLVVFGIIAILLALLLPAVSRAREASRRINCVNNLKQLDLAVHEYVTAYDCLPSGTYNPSGPVDWSPDGYKISWIASLLPYMEQTGMYRALDFNRGAGAPANFTVRATQINTLLCPSQGSAGWNYLAGRPGIAGPLVIGSSYAACHNDVEAPIDVGNHGCFSLNSQIRVEQITDGLSETIFLGEVPVRLDAGWISGTRSTLRNTGHPINGVDVTAVKSEPTLPAEITPRELEEFIIQGRIEIPKTFVGGFGSSHVGEGANFAFGDGSVRFLRQSIDQAVYRRLGHRADGEVIDADAY